MKRLLLITVLLLTSCSDKFTRFDNVDYKFNEEKSCYNVTANEKDYVVELEDVHTVYVSNYLTANDDSGHLAMNSFYIKNDYNYWLVFYKLDR